VVGQLARQVGRVGREIEQAVAAQRGQDDLLRLYEAHFAEGRPVFEPAELVAVGEAAGLDGDLARQVLADGTYADAVQADEEQARRLGITGVPFAVTDGKYGVSGAQPSAAFGQVLERAWREQPANA
jgi:predicted DsbA family dithiol-disulfide isomerase